MRGHPRGSVSPLRQSDRARAEAECCFDWQLNRGWSKLVCYGSTKFRTNFASYYHKPFWRDCFYFRSQNSGMCRTNNKYLLVVFMAKWCNSIFAPLPCKMCWCAQNGRTCRAGRSLSVITFLRQTNVFFFRFGKWVNSFRKGPCRQICFWVKFFGDGAKFRQK